MTTTHLLQPLISKHAAQYKKVKKPTDDMCNMQIVNKLTSIFNTKNRFAISDMLFDELKFVNTNYITIGNSRRSKKRNISVEIKFNINSMIIFIYFTILFLYILSAFSRILK
jgi:hypothetical protein